MASFNSTVIARVAAALYDLQLGNETMDWALEQANATGGVASVVQSVYDADFGNMSYEQVAQTIVANVGITGSIVEVAEAAVVEVLTAGGDGNEGQSIVTILNAFAGMTAHDNADIAAAATAFNSQISAAVAYAALDDTTDVPVHTTAHKLFTLTPAEAAGADVMRLTGDQDVRISFTNPNNQVVGLDLDGDGVVEFNGGERSITGVAAGFEIVDAYARNPFDHTDTANNFLGDIDFDGTGFEGDGVATNGNIFLGGLGADTALSGDGNDFLAGGGIAQGHGGIDTLHGGRNADFFFAQFSGIDADETDGMTLRIDGGNTADDTKAGVAQSLQDADWLLFEASDDQEPVRVFLNEDGTAPVFDGSIDVASRTGETMEIADVENFDASGNLYGFLDDMDVEIGGRGMDDRDTAGNSNYGIGSSAQIELQGSDVGNTVVAGYDNDYVDGNAGNDLLRGGNLQQLFETVEGGSTNPNLTAITLDGLDELLGGSGNDGLVFEADGGTLDGDGGGTNADGSPIVEGTDTLWLTNYALGTNAVADATTDGVLRFDLGGQDDATGQDDEAELGFAGYGGADRAGTADQTNYTSATSAKSVGVDNFEIIDASGLSTGDRGLDYFAAGTNNPDLVFNNRQNFAGYDGDLDLRGALNVDNQLFAGAGDDVLEGRGGDDEAAESLTAYDVVLQGGSGDDDFFFAIDGDVGGDETNIIRRKVDANNDGFWDGSDVKGTAGTWGQDFGLDETTTVGESVLRIVIQRAGGNADGEELGDVVNSVERITTGVEVDGEFVEVVLESDAISDADTYEDLVDAINAALAETDFADDLSASLQDDGVTIFIADAQGRELADTDAEVDGAGVLINQKANTATENEFEFGEPEAIVSQDRLIFKAYEDRSDNEGVDDDATTGSTVSLGADAYAEDLVVSFAADGTRIAEDQEYVITFTNLTTQDKVTVNVNGVTYSLTVGVAVNGTQIDGEDTVETDLEDVQENFLARLAAFINSFMDDDTAAGEVSATSTATTLTITQADYNGEETVFMTAPTVTIDNNSGGEKATAAVDNDSQTEVHLYNFDGQNNNLNATNVLFWGQEAVSRSILETALDTGDTIVGSEAVVVDGGSGAGDDDLADIDHNIATDTDLDENFAVHGDDYLLGGDGDDNISGLTGDDRIRGSLGNDVLDGGGDWYAVLREGDDEYTVEYLNAFEAAELDADGDVLDIVLIEQTESGTGMIAGTAFEAYFDDTLIYHQADFTAGVTRFTITLNDYAGTGEDIVFDNGGAGTVGVDANGDGTVEADNVSTFTNFENIRTVAGVGNAVAGTNGGQGRDTLNVMALSDDADVGVKYDLTGDATAGDVYLIEDLDDDAGTPATLRQLIKVDGVENVIFGDGDDILDIDETEAAKDNDITGDLGVDEISYENDFAGEVVEGDDEPTVTINVGSAHGTATDAGVDTVVMTEGRVGSVVATDTLRGIEEVTLGGNTAAGIREDDELNVEALSGGATVNYVTGQVFSDTDGDLDFADGVLQMTINGIAQLENVVADGRDNVVVADSDTMGDNKRTDNFQATPDADLTIDTFLNYDLLDRRDEDDPERLSVSELRSIADGTSVLTADVSDIPEGFNINQFTFSLGADSDVVDYSNANDDIAVVVDFNTDDDRQYVLVDGGANSDFGVLNDSSNLDRIDVLNDVENIVASQGESILDVTNSTQALAITFSREITVVGGKDVHRVQLSNLNTDVVVGKNFLEFRDNDADDDNDGSTAVTGSDPADIRAVWNRVEGSDFNEKVELTDAETTDDHEFNLRGGDNEVNYNELTRSIELTLDIVDYDPATPATTGLINGTVIFYDGSGNTPADVIGGTDTISSYSAQNGIAAGSLRVEASQDAEDVLAFAGALDDKLFILGEVVSGSDQITVRIGSGDAENSIELTGFEFLRDSAQDDVYQLEDIERVQENLTLIDNPTDDRDTVRVFDDAVAYDGGPAALTAAADTISLEVLNDVLGFDFDVLDITLVEEDDLLLVADDDDQDNDATLNTADTDYIGPADTDDDGDTETARDLDDDVIVGDLGLIDSVLGFDSIFFTDASIDSAGDTFVLDVANDELEDGDDDVLFDTNVNGLNFSMVTTGGVTVSVSGNEAVEIVGTGDDDTITGGGAGDVIQGGGGADELDGGSVAEVRAFQLALPLDAAATATVTVDFNAGPTLTLNEVAAIVDTDADTGDNLDILAGSTVDQVGAALVQLINANLDEINAVADNYENAAGDDVAIVSVSYDAVNDTIVFTFENGFDVLDADVVTFADTDAQALMGDAGTNATVTTQGSDGGADDFLYAAASEGGDTISGFVTGADQVTFENTAGSLTAADLGDLIDDGDNGAIAFTSAADADGAASEAVAADPEALFIDSANNGTFAASALTNLTSVAALFETNFALDAASDATWDALLVLESDTEGTFGVYFWDAADDDETIEASELTLIAVVTGDDVATGDFGLV